MAFHLRKSKRAKGIYLQIYESYRDPETKLPKSKHIKTLGYADYLESLGVKDPINFYTTAVRTMNDKRKIQTSKKKLIEKNIPEKRIGFFVPAAIYRRLDVKNDIDYLQYGRKFEYNLSDCLELLIYSRLCNPMSKFKTVNEIFPTLYGQAQFSYDQTLSCLELLGREYEKVVEIFTHHTHETYILDINQTYFDCTNFYFEIDAQDDWRRKGPSKENRTDPIIGMGLLLDANCLPIGMRLYPGNQSEKPVMREVLHDLKNKQGVTGKTVRVADKGLNCAENIHDAILAHDGYIFSKSVLQLPEDEMEWAIEDEGFQEVIDRDGRLAYKMKSKLFQHKYDYRDENGRKHSLTVTEKRVVTFNPSLARKKRREITRLEEKAKNLCASAAKKSDYGDSAKYMIFTTENKSDNGNKEKVIAVLNTNLIEKHRKCAGFNMLITSEYKMDDSTIYQTYHELWHIEESFRTMKSSLDARPVYLQNYDRIKGHFLVCYLSVLLERLFQYKVLKNKFGSEKVYNFMHELKVLPTGPYTFINISPKCDINDYLSKTYNLPLDHYYLERTQINKILEKHF
ncbi:IS1634 family transposase [Allobaculum sp. JKK-2023]|uniref:IS1634 family transposase n=1 Tax=Allobaculum sp. JKK-2023 TaxID=3108943 RepID=UPI002B05D034|nr:IS1634 family transposase [Allobaculum sp. JKK-2023]